MNNLTIAKTNKFHGHLDTELVFHPGRVVETKETKYFVIQERDLSYRFYLHQHPYVQPLVQWLIRKGTDGLQAADTEYVPNDASLPGSIEFALSSNMNLTVPAGSRIALLAKVQATSGGVPIELAPNRELKSAGAVLAALRDGMKAALVDGMTGTPPVGAVFVPPANSKAVVFGDTKIVLAAAGSFTLHDGTQTTIPAGTQVLLAGGTQLTIPNGVQVTLLKSKPLPVLFADFFDAAYKPDMALVQRPYPVKDLDFTSGGAYAVYNWELFFHVPITIAIHLSKNQRFAEAQRWFHYLFDPTDDSDGPTPERFWKVRPFQYTDVKKIEEILVNLATGADETLRDETIRSIEAWKDAPFRPHVIARYRQQAYMYKTVMAYLDNLIAWGDSLFRQDTGEAIDEALQLYVLAANILGPRPLPVPKKGTVRPQTYANLRQDLGQFGTVMRDMEPDLPFDLLPFPTDDQGDNDRLATLRSPTAKIHLQPMGTGGTVEFGGKEIGPSFGAAAGAARAIAERLNFEARRASRIDSFARREREWASQSNLGAGEIAQIFKQLRAAQIREAIAEMELKNHRQQMKHAEEIERFLNGEGTEKKAKKTNKALYAWMKREVKGLYSQCFQFAFDISKKAERALQHELGSPELSYLQFGYLGGKEGLLAGEKLYLDVKRMEMAFHELNQREYELTKHVSLLQVDRLALIQLRTTGRCTVRLPEALFDMDGLGHYFRRIKTVAMSIPCVTGPYASINCTLTLLKSSIRKTPVW